MKGLILGTVSALLVSAIAAPSLRAETKVLNPAQASNITNTQNDLSAFNLVFLAQRGYLESQGIPGYNGLVSGYHSGSVTAEDIVQGAVDANRLAPDSLDDRQYMNAVEAQLASLSYAR